MMAMVIDQQQQQLQEQQSYKYYCRICKKGFGCSRALGGHMRAHGVNDVDPVDDSSGCSEWSPPSNKRMYELRSHPNRLKSCRFCENCGKEFLSWKSFLRHGKRTSDDDDEEYYYDSLAMSDDEGGVGHCAGRSKGKRSCRRGSKSVAPAPSEEEDLANCLVMLSSTRVDPTAIVNEPEESCASASKDGEVRLYQRPVSAVVKSKGPAPKGMFECTACGKVFTSHQALGGHRASHKKVKGCFASKTDNLIIDQEDAKLATAMVPFDNAPLSVVPIKKKSKVHECSICHRQFASGQALGGHKRCHWITSNSHDPTATGKQQAVQINPGNRHHELTLRPMFGRSERIDLNLPAANYLPLRNNTTSTTAISSNDRIIKNNNYEEGGCSMSNVVEEVSSKVKLAKLSELKDMRDGGEASPWLQVGIGSSGNDVD